MSRFIKDCLVLLLEFLDSWDARRIARDEELLRLQQENGKLYDQVARLTLRALREAKAERAQDRLGMTAQPKGEA